MNTKRKVAETDSQVIALKEARERYLKELAVAKDTVRKALKRFHDETTQIDPEKIKDVATARALFKKISRFGGRGQIIVLKKWLTLSNKVSELEEVACCAAGSIDRNSSKIEGITQEEVMVAWEIWEQALEKARKVGPLRMYSWWTHEKSAIIRAGIEEAASNNIWKNKRKNRA